MAADMLRARRIRSPCQSYMRITILAGRRADPYVKTSAPLYLREGIQQHDSTDALGLAQRHGEREADPKREVELSRVRKGERELRCLAVYLPSGSDVQLIEGRDFRRTRRLKMASSAHPCLTS
jgi:hypothetical protein